MKRIAARMLRRLADKLHPIQTSQQIHINLDGPTEEAVVKALRRHVRVNGGL